MGIGYHFIRPIAGGEGGECVLVKQHRIDPDCTSDSVTAADNLAHPDNIGTSDPTPAPRENVRTSVKSFYRDHIIDIDFLKKRDRWN